MSRTIRSIHGGFEGTIPEGQYGAGRRDRLGSRTWTPDGDPHAGYAKGHLDFVLHGHKLKGRWHLVRMHPRPGEKGDNWLLIKGDDEEARGPRDPDILKEEPNSVVSGRSIDDIAGDKKSRRWTSGRAAQGRIETLGSHVRVRWRRWIVSSNPIRPRRSGVRRSPRKPTSQRASRLAERPVVMLLRRPRAQSARRSRTFSRPCSRRSPRRRLRYAMDSRAEIRRLPHRSRGESWGGETADTHWALIGRIAFRTIAVAIAALAAREFIIDAKSSSREENGVSDFSALQNALSEGDASGMVYYAFDLLAIDGYDLTALPIVERKEALAILLMSAPKDTILRLSEHFDENGDLMLQHVCRLGAEGIVSKKRDSAYISKRTPRMDQDKMRQPAGVRHRGLCPLDDGAQGDRFTGGRLLRQGASLNTPGASGTGYSNKMAAGSFADLSREKVAKPASAHRSRQRRAVMLCGSNQHGSRRSNFAAGRRMRICARLRSKVCAKIKTRKTSFVKRQRPCRTTQDTEDKHNTHAFRSRLMAGRGRHQAGTRGFLRNGLAVDRETSRRPAVGSIALSERHRAGRLFSETSLGRYRRSYPPNR